MFKLAHFSDVHLPLGSSSISVRELLSRRIAGYINWKFNRQYNLDENVIRKILEDIIRHNPNHWAITGDFVNLALDSEFKNAKLWLEKLGTFKEISIVPGNHDAYIPGRLDVFKTMFSEWMRGDDDTEKFSLSSFPYLRVRDDVAIIGLCSALTTLPLISAGYFKKKEGKRLASLLEETKKRGLFRLLMIHHPPVKGALSWSKGLFGLSRFQKIIKEQGAELILHGHSHVPSLFKIEGPQQAIPVVGVSCASQKLGGKRSPAQWNLIEIEKKESRWNVQLKRRGIKTQDQKIFEIEAVRLM